MDFYRNRRWIVSAVLLIAVVAIAGCTSGEQPARAPDQPSEAASDERHSDELDTLTLPDLEAADLGDEKLRIVATTSVIGDVVSHVGGDKIDLTVLMGPGQDPHSYDPSASDLTKVANAHLIFVNGWDLEEGLLRDLKNVSDGVALVPVSANITPLAFGRHLQEDLDGEDHQESADPHTWLDPHLVGQWIKNLEHVLASLDPANVAAYESNAEAYRQELDTLIQYYDEQVEMIPADQRKLVTNHNSFGYFAEAYDFEVVGTVVPAASTLAEPSASELIQLVKVMESEGVCTIFSEISANEQLVEAVAAEIANCDQVKVKSLYTGALGPPGSGADSYLGLMRANIDLIVGSLK